MDSVWLWKKRIHKICYLLGFRNLRVKSVISVWNLEICGVNLGVRNSWSFIQKLLLLGASWCFDLKWKVLSKYLRFPRIHFDKRLRERVLKFRHFAPDIFVPTGWASASRLMYIITNHVRECFALPMSGAARLRSLRERYALQNSGASLISPKGVPQPYYMRM